MEAALIVLMVCVVLVTISALIYTIKEYQKTEKSETKYPYYCKQPETALRNHCNYYGSFNNKCLCPYGGCNLQGIKNKTEEES